MTAPVRTATVQFKAEGVPDVQAATRAVQRAAEDASKNVRDATRAGLETAADRAREKWGMAGREIAKSMADFGRTGEIAGRELKQLAVVGGEMAVMFSPIGPVASAVALLTLGIVSMFKRARDEQKATQEQFIKGLSDMAAAADYAALQMQAGKLWRGTYNPKTGQFDGGAKSLLAQQRELQQTSAFDLGGPGRMKGFLSQTVKSPLDGKDMTVQELLNQYAETVALMQTPLDGLPKPRAPITTTYSAGAAAQVAKQQWEAELQRAVREFGAGKADRKEWGEFASKLPIGPMATDWMQRLLADPSTRATILAAAGSPGSASTAWQNEAGPGFSFGKRDEKQWDKDFALTLLRISDRAKALVGQARATLNTVGMQIADGITEGLSAGLQSAFESLFSGRGLTNAVQSLKQSILSALGRVFANVAMDLLKIATLMDNFQTWLVAHPATAIIAAAAMLAIASQMGGVKANFAGAGGGSYVSSAASAANNEQVTRLLWGADSATVAAGMTPRQSNTFVIVGPGDPQAQRAIQELLRNANRRGG